MKTKKKKVGRPIGAKNENGTPQRFVLKSEAARILGVGRGTIENLCRSGELLTVKLGRGTSTRIVRASLMSLAERLEKEGAR